MRLSPKVGYEIEIQDLPEQKVRGRFSVTTAYLRSSFTLKIEIWSNIEINQTFDQIHKFTNVSAIVHMYFLYKLCSCF